MKLMPIANVSDLDRSVSFYEMLGCRVRRRSRSGGWVELEYGDALIALHESRAPLPSAEGRVALCFEAQEPLETLLARLRLRADIIDESFGRIAVLTDPDGLPIQINGHDPSLYAHEETA